MGSWSLKLLSKGMKSKTKDNKYQPKNNHKKHQKDKMGNNTYHGQLSQK